jgi:hypothetical protein
VKKLFTLFCGSVIAFSLSTAAFAQAAPAQEKMDKMAKHSRWEGVVIRSDPDQKFGVSEGSTCLGRWRASPEPLPS